MTSLPTNDTSKLNFRKSLILEDFVMESQKIVEDYQCPLCLGIYLDPQVDQCGHVFCHKCISEYFVQNGHCPISGSTKTEINPLFIVNAILDKQMVLCKNRENQCEWIGKLSELYEHINTSCKRQICNCPFDGCKIEICREDIPKHARLCDYRITTCNDCEIQVAFIYMPLHQTVCPRFKIDCPQCGEKVERQLIETHTVETCLDTVIPCPYSEYGCMTTITKRNLGKYLSNNSERHNLTMLTWIKESNEKHEKKFKMIEEFLADKYATSIFKEAKKNGSAFTSGTTTPLNLEFNQMTCQDKTFSGKKRQRVEMTETVVVIENHKSEKIDTMEIVQEESTCEIVNFSPNPSPVTKCKIEIVKKKDILFDAANTNKGVKVNANKAICLSNIRSEHRFALTNFQLNNQKVTEWKAIINSTSNWVAVGVCNKELVINNKLRFVGQENNYSHGVFGISTNGYSWNANNSLENNLPIPNFPNSVIKGETVTFRYSSELREITYKLEKADFSGKITDVGKDDKHVSLVPCAIFLNENDEIIFE